MKKHLLFFTFLFSFFNFFAQQDAWVYLVDKQDVLFPISNPNTFLTQKAIKRKNAHAVTIDSRDVPVNETYISQLKNAIGITVMAKSKWFNAVHVRGDFTDINNLKTNLLFVDHIDFADKSLNTPKIVRSKKEAKFQESTTVFNYGSAANQIQMFKGEQLHLSNYTGTGMTVAVLDAGFPNVHTMAGFQRLRNANNIKGTYDFVNRNTNVYTNTTSNHGTLVLSTMAGYIENQYVGTAPDASYYLFITEDAPNENPVEESYWVEAAERADSLGVDVINTSLGYTTYDNPNYSYTTADMNGNTAFITKGANIAFEKGMLLVNSAGNSGNDTWGIVGAPADASGVLSIGAVKPDGTYALFSSAGNSIQPTQKPDVVAQGQGSIVITENDVIAAANGTSFSSPIMAGGVICLWQALSSLNNSEIMQLVRESASQFSMPDNYLGFGIPNLQVALENGIILEGINDQNENLNVYPNPATHEILITSPLSEVVEAYLFDISGKLVIQKQMDTSNRSINISTLSKGVYLVKLQTKEQIKTVKIIKQ